MAKTNTNGMGRRGGGRGSDREVVINSGQRKTMGTGAYSLRPDSPSTSEFRAGMLSHKEGVDKSDGPDNRTSKRRQTSAQAMGARYTISPNVNAVVQADPRTQRSSRIVPPATGSRRNFWSS